ncbi:co-chaperone GroES [Patescibacteria group bacterium]|nr:co-chaperone GroES [Patescibacteria group bacterium]MBU1721673.1 co-chaperone GroES [Patescibacteria group bacterium]MBU1900982.1 co-chaperone GroES [Patescibacteria group bacterium]
MNIKPLGNRVLIQLAKEDEVTKSGIVLPSNVDKEKKTEGKIIAVGPGKVSDTGTPIAMEVSVGDNVLVKSWGGDDVTMNGEEYKIFDAEDILAIIE